eukprot:m.862796 g.862796  ORF g.862796 m.862796 type:complete len:73 (-) comp23536_c1_seq17:585-803(-)
MCIRLHDLSTGATAGRIHIEYDGKIRDVSVICQGTYAGNFHASRHNLATQPLCTGSITNTTAHAVRLTICAT